VGILVGVMASGCVLKPIPRRARTQEAVSLASDHADQAVESLRPTANQELLIHLDMARALEAQGQSDKALAEYQRAVQRYRPSMVRTGSREQRATLHRRLAAAYDRLGRFDEAASHYAAARRLNPQDPKVWNDWGYSAYVQGHWDDAVKRLRKAVQLDPSDSRAQTNLGLALAASGQTEHACEVLARAHGPAAARANVAYVLAAQGKTDAARSMYRQALEIDAQNTVVRRALATLDRAPTHDGAVSRVSLNLPSDQAK
jgi:Flp pilus assembly protein TadD